MDVGVSVVTYCRRERSAIECVRCNCVLRLIIFIRPAGQPNVGSIPRLKKLPAKIKVYVLTTKYDCHKVYTYVDNVEINNNTAFKNVFSFV